MNLQDNICVSTSGGSMLYKLKLTLVPKVVWASNPAKIWRNICQASWCKNRLYNGSLKWSLSHHLIDEVKSKTAFITPGGIGSSMLYPLDWHKPCHTFNNSWTKYFKDLILPSYTWMISSSTQKWAGTSATPGRSLQLSTGSLLATVPERCVNLELQQNELKSNLKASQVYKFWINYYGEI